MKIEISTADGDGNRKWVYPIVSEGKWFNRRKILSIGLISWLLVAPWLTWKGKQLVFFDLIQRKIHFLGQTFWVNETIVFLAFVFLLIGLLLLLTAAFGRVFCGWACPMTVFMEFVFRPIERLIEGMGFQQREFKRLPLSERIIPQSIKWSVFTVIALVLGNTFVAYFFGAHHLLSMIKDGPMAHQGIFLAMIAVSSLILFQFGWFREQVCLFVCPYGRLQSVLLDKDSLIVAYDEKRGEPRGKPGRTSGDCVDCKMCIKVCPTGIDIRQGLQLECIHCTQCIDACDDVMAKLKRPLGLIRYQTENEVEGTKVEGHSKLMRPRILAYATIVMGVSSLLIFLTAGRLDFSATAHREASSSVFSVDEQGLVVNPIHLNLANHSEKSITITLKPLSPASLTVVVPEGSIQLKPDEKAAYFILLKAPQDIFHENFGLADTAFEIISDSGSRKEISIRMVGPAH